MSTGTALLGTQQAYRLNSVYDPDYTGAGHQPYGFDQLSGLYNKYRVDRVKFEIIYTTPGGTHDMLCVATVSPGTTSSLTGATLYAGQERPGGIWGLLSPNGERRCVLKGAYDLNVVCGVPKQKYVSDDEYSSSISSNPTQLALLTHAVGCADGTAAISAVAVVVITYDVVFFDRITQSSS